MKSESGAHSVQAEGGHKARANDAVARISQHRDAAQSPIGGKDRTADLTVSFLKVSLAY